MQYRVCFIDPDNRIVSDVCTFEAARSDDFDAARALVADALSLNPDQSPLDILNTMMTTLDSVEAAVEHAQRLRERLEHHPLVLPILCKCAREAGLTDEIAGGGR